MCILYTQYTHTSTNLHIHIYTGFSAMKSLKVTQGAAAVPPPPAACDNPARRAMETSGAVLRVLFSRRPTRSDHAIGRLLRLFRLGS